MNGRNSYKQYRASLRGRGLKHVDVEQRQHEVIFLMGAPAAGKSTIGRKLYGKTHTFIDCDAIAATYPDYDVTNPSATHFRASAEAEQVFQSAIATGQGRWAVDSTGSNAERMVTSIKQARAAGFEISLLYVKCSLETSLQRNARRERVVPEQVVREKFATIATSFEIVSMYVDNVKVIDNDLQFTNLNAYAIVSGDGQLIREIEVKERKVMTMDEMKTKAEEVELATGCELYDVTSDGGDVKSFEDDGILHVIIDGMRAAFDVSENQHLSRKQQNAKTRKVMAAFGLPVTQRVLC